ncbi:hypothetical protein [Massilia sp. CCM 8734]|uniref:hypothetical protein n=1 Tax=Massilia sp. CCM 8734 TaxID=2609283 RepID=UPI00142168CB|nr:hypothetical protein [Massilia sp. CCM 8734]NHZ98571.1 hypothetical protein [Massilia sp. CCM 8734]
MARTSHPRKEIEQALKYAEANGWRIKVGGSHAWGSMFCPYDDGQCRGGEYCRSPVFSTPRSTGNHARFLRRVIDNCTIHKANS